MDMTFSRRMYRAARRLPLVNRLFGRALSGIAQDAWRAQMVRGFIKGPFGSAYGITATDRARLVEQFARNTRSVQSGTSDLSHLILAQEVLSIPPERKGDLIECGAWKGASSASLSLLAQLSGRRLLVADSFCGLPDDGMQLHTNAHNKVYGYYQPGMFAGSLDEVRRNVAQLGVLSACEFVQGFFADSLPRLKGPLCFAFLDVDLVSSTRDCLRHLWPLLSPGSAVYTDDAGDMDVVRVFFDEGWWQEQVGCAAPGYVGSGCGLPLSPSSSSLGYTRKMVSFDKTQWQQAPWLYYPGPGPGPGPGQLGSVGGGLTGSQGAIRVRLVTSTFCRW